MKFHIPEMNCGHCKATVTTALTTLDPAAQVEVDLTTRTIAVSSTRDAAAIIAALDGVGFDASPA